MPGRLDLRPLGQGALNGLRKRRATTEEPADLTARAVLFGGPILAALLIAVPRVTLRQPAPIAAAAGLLVGALLGGFALLAGWKDRLAAADRDTDQIRIRALDEAVAHVLVAVIASMTTTVCMSTIANIDYTMAHPTHLRTGVVVAFSAFGVAALTYVAVSLVIVVNLLWDAYSATTVRTRIRH